MKIKLKPDKYVVAVSGGVDSVVLLDLLCSQLENAGQNLSVAHFDHGIRKDSAEDRKFVGNLAKKYGVKFYYEEGRLGTGASEALAREKRYEFLNRIKNQTGSDAILTAHHQDDLIETIIINLLRGTGRKGLSSLSDRRGLLRPLLSFSKSELVSYAQKNNLDWREDETNRDEKYLRNYVRRNVAVKLTGEQRRALLKISQEAHVRNKQIDDLLTGLFFQNKGIARQLFASLGHDVSAEIIAKWLRQENMRLDKKTVDRLAVRLKTAREGKVIQASQTGYFIVHKGIIRLNTSKRCIINFYK